MQGRDSKRSDTAATSFSPLMMISMRSDTSSLVRRAESSNSPIVPKTLTLLDRLDFEVSGECIADKSGEGQLSSDDMGDVKGTSVSCSLGEGAEGRISRDPPDDDGADIYIDLNQWAFSFPESRYI
jgi:hypothetical protein